MVNEVVIIQCIINKYLLQRSIFKKLKTDRFSAYSINTYTPGSENNKICLSDIG